MHDREGTMIANVEINHSNIGEMYASALESGVIDCFMFAQMKLMNSGRH